MSTDGIRRALGPLLRTVANTAVEKAVAPPLQPAAKAVTNFAVSSFERGRSPLVALSPPPPPPAPQVDGKLEAGDWLSVTDKDGANQRQRPTTKSGINTTFTEGTLLKIIPPPDNGAVSQEGFVYVESRSGKQGWVHESLVGEVSEEFVNQVKADELAKKRAENHQTDAADAYQGIYVNQFDAEKQVGDPSARNANCGPASTLMALRNEGLTLPPIPDVTSSGTAGDEVQAARYWGSTNTGNDGVTTNDAGETVYALGEENSLYTGFKNVRNAVTAAGGTCEDVAANSASIKTAIESGMSVVISGNFVEPSAQDPEGAPVLKGDTWEQGGGAEEHLVAVVGMTPEGNFIVCDPASACRTPIEVTAEELDAFMRGNAGAIGIAGPATE
ncbi:hypothetical protein D7X96_22110 [Corallococcus interemptor]|uniref:Uncharacterized protein n=3 Tax=Corallococcus TaxID=83461 RepID=A0A3A8QIP5_9BACT|nr:C39 family peptidase [Corallococcus interemptor]RKH66195.1 hypothetical protein D7X96_22110 [Corallococcus interemptor]